MELTELLQSAQTALDKGEYRLAAAAARHILATYPSCLSGHRMLGEACLEQGEAAEAAEHFGRALSLDPLHVVARLGLGVAMEESGDLDTAHAAYLQAWELNPALDSVRDELLRLRTTLNERLPAGDPAWSERLHRTRAGLAAIHARTGQLTRAVAEWRAVLAATPESDVAQTALAEVLWRQGDDVAALQACRPILERTPSALRALAIRAEIERRHNDPAATATAETYRGLDPAGEMVAVLLLQTPDANLAWLMPPPAELAPFDPATVVALPAPEPSGPDPAPATAEPAVDLAATAPGQQLPAPDLWDNLVRDITGELRLARSAEQPESVEPFVWDGDADLAIQAPAEDLGGRFVETGPATLSANGHGSSDSSAAVAVLERPRAAQTDAANVGIRSESVAGRSVGIDQFVTADGRVDLTVGWDDLDQALAAARPEAVPLREDDPLLAEFAADGIAPFDVTTSTGDDDAWEPFGEADFAPPTATIDGGRPIPNHDTSSSYSFAETESADRAPGSPRAALQTEEFDLAAITANWDSVEQELAAAIPADAPSGYTEMLSNLGVEHLEPFRPEDGIDTLAPPDVAGEPLAFDELLQVAGPEEPFPTGDPVARPVLMPDPELGTTEALELAALQPFTFEDLDPAPADEGFDFSDLDTPGLGVADRVAPPEQAAPSPSWEDPGVVEASPPDGRWPSFVADTSELVDRYGEVGDLFARLREEKAALIGLGMLRVDRSLTRRAAGLEPVLEIEEPAPIVDGAARTEPTASVRTTELLRPVDEAVAAEAGELRRRMRLGEAEMGEMAASVAARFTGAEGEQPLARLLGEAYLALGRGDLAAAHFRAARCWRVAAGASTSQRVGVES